MVIAGKTYGVNIGEPRNLAIPLQFNGAQPNFFGAANAQATPFSSDGFVADTQRGGSCNVQEIRMTPHCNGTHTEAVGHIVHRSQAVFESLPQSLMAAVVVSVAPVPAGQTKDAYRPEPASGDVLITREALAAALGAYARDELTALIVRTLPNHGEKKSKTYDDKHPPAFFSTDATCYLVEQGVQHLLVDLPSIDKMHDEGKLTNHHIFWNVPEGTQEVTRHTCVTRTITEMIFVDDAIDDGLYLLNLQMPAFHSDAVPSRPVIYTLEPSP